MNYIVLVSYWFLEGQVDQNDSVPTNSKKMDYGKAVGRLG